MRTRRLPPTPVSLFLSLLLVATASVANAAYTSGVNARSLTHDSLLREYDVYAPPSYDGSTPVALIVDIHGASSNKAQQMGISGWTGKADAEGFLVVYPQGIGNTWNAGVCCGGNTNDDVGFLLAMVDAIELEGNVDASQIFVTGLSNGGAMTHRMACEAADVFAAAAPLAFPTPYTNFATQCTPASQIPLLLTMGLTDIVVPYSGGIFGGAVPSFEAWRAKNGCGTGTPEDHFEQGTAFCDVDTSCAGAVSVGLCSVTGIDFPPPLNIFNGHVLYSNVDGVNLADKMWEFFQTGTIAGDPPPAVPASGALPVLALVIGLGALGGRLARHRADLRRADRDRQGRDDRDQVGGTS